MIHPIREANAIAQALGRKLTFELKLYTSSFRNSDDHFSLSGMIENELLLSSNRLFQNPIPLQLLYVLLIRKVPLHEFILCVLLPNL